MEEGNWIEMTGISLITAEGTAVEGVAADDVEGGGAETGRGADHGAKGLTGQGAEAAHDDKMERTAPTERDPAHEMEDASGDEHATLAVGTPPPEAPAADAENVVHAPVEEAAETARGPTGGDADDASHVTQLEAALLAVSSPAREAHPEGAGDAETEPPPAAAAEAEV
jgi:hypothetical protein